MVQVLVQALFDHGIHAVYRVVLLRCHVSLERLPLLLQSLELLTNFISELVQVTGRTLLTVPIQIG